MEQIRFDDGVREFGINGDDGRVIRVCLTDMNLPGRIAVMEDRIGEIADRIRAKSDPTPELLMQLDRDVRQILNDAFGSDICTAAFGTANCCSPVAGGKLMMQGFVEALSARIRAELDALNASEKPLRPEVTAYLDDSTETANADSLLAGIAACSDAEREKILRALQSR